jgi:diketogulonate reductase-like aldo/keto reductase
MAYSPLDEGRLVTERRLGGLATRAGATPAQVALGWLLAQKVAIIAKAADAAHVRDNRSALALSLGQDLRQEIERAFPPPTRPTPLRTI